MPHQCTDCDHVFPDGSKAMLSGCPDCGGNTFQFLPKEAMPSDESATADDEAPSGRSVDSSDDTGSAGRVPIDSAEPVEPATPNGSDSETPTEPSRAEPPSRGPVERATAAVREWVRVDSPTAPPSRDSLRRNGNESTRAPSSNEGEDDAAIENDTDRERAGDDAIEPVAGSSRSEGVEGNGNDPSISDPASTSANAGTEPGTDVRTESDVEPADDPTEVDDDSVEADDEPADVDDPHDVGDAIDTNDTVDASDTVDVDDTGNDIEDRAQANARPDVVTPSELPATAADSQAPPPDAEGGRIASEPSDVRPDLDELRRELNDQFESIRIVAPGQYELNLMELYNREEYIIALREDGRYAIEAPETWLGRRDERD